MQSGQFDVESTIGGFRVVTTILDPEDAYALAPRVIQMLLPVLKAQGQILPVLAHFAGVKTTNLTQTQMMDLLAKIDLGEFAPVLDQIVSQLADPKNKELPRELLKRTVIFMPDADGEMRRCQLTSKADINSAFRGKLKLMLRVMLFSAMENFSDFLPGK